MRFNVEMHSLLLLFIANGAPVAARYIFRDRLAYPIDGGLCLLDGRPLLGRSKTLRGVAAAILATAVAAAALGLPIYVGALFGLFSMVGDLSASFIKRRLGLAPSEQAVGLDQIPEAALPLLALRIPLELSWIDLTLIIAAFFVLELLFSQILFRLGIREQPY